MSSVFVLCNLLQKWVCYACPKFWKFLPECTVPEFEHGWLLEFVTTGKWSNVVVVLFSRQAKCLPVCWSSDVAKLVKAWPSCLGLLDCTVVPACPLSSSVLSTKVVTRSGVLDGVAAWGVGSEHSHKPFSSDFSLKIWQQKSTNGHN